MNGIASSSVNAAIDIVSQDLEKEKRNLWIAAVKITVLAVALIALAITTVALVAPTPYAIVLLPLAAIFLVYCVLPAAKYIKNMISQIKAAKANILENQTTLTQLRACRQTLSEDSSFARFLAGARTPREILHAHQRYLDLSSPPEFEFPPEAQL